MKRILKGLVPQQIWSSMSWWRIHFGLWAAIRTHTPLLWSRERLLRVDVAVEGKRARVFLRPGTTDLDVFEEVFKQREYHLNVELPDGVIDAGAHIGLATVVWALRFPDAKIVALEPEASNFSLLELNTRGFANVHRMKVGLWARSAMLEVVDPGHSTWGFRVREAAPDSDGVAAIGMVDVLNQLQGCSKVLLKMDIEGSEVEVLSTSSQWISRIRTLVVELHDRFRPGCTEALERALDGHLFKRSVSGESVVISQLAPS